jgi:hypothetical protein
MKLDETIVAQILDHQIALVPHCSPQQCCWLGVAFTSASD